MKPWEETWSIRRCRTVVDEAYGPCTTIEIAGGGLANRLHVVGSTCSGSEEERCTASRAHAILAAAAPDLYRALDEIVYAADRGAVSLRADVLEALELARAALRKARGET